MNPLPTKIIYEKPRPLFWQKYNTVFSGNLDYVSYFRKSIKPRSDDDLRAFLKLHRSSVTRHLSLTNHSSSGLLTQVLPAFLIGNTNTEQEIDDAFELHFKALQQVRDLVIGLNDKDARVTFTVDNIKLYTNDDAVVDSFASVASFKNCAVRKLQTVLPNAVYSKSKVEYPYRTYFNSIKIDATAINTLLNYDLNGELKLSPSLLKELSKRNTSQQLIASFYTRTHYYVEYHDPKNIGFLNLIAPNLLGRSITFVPQ